MTPATFQRYRDINDSWRWRIIADDGHPLADGTHSFDDAAGLDIHLDRLRQAAPQVSIVDGGTGAILLHSGGCLSVLDSHGQERSHVHDAPVEGSDHLNELDPTTFQWTSRDVDIIQWIVDNWERLPGHTAEPGLFLCHIGHDSEWRWQLYLDGEVVAESGEGYATREAAEAAARRTRTSIESADEDTWGDVQNA